MRQPWLWLGSIIFWLVRFEFAAGFPAKIGLAGNLTLSADVFPRQGGLRLLKKSDKFLAFFVFWRKIKI